MGKHDLHTIQKLLPNENCALCNAPSCATTARRIVAGKMDPEACVMIDRTNLERIREIMAEGVETHKEVGQDQPFIEIQPCAEYGRVTLEAQLPKPKGSVYDLFDSCTMCTAFSDISDLDGVKCSLELGYGLAQLQEKRIHVFKSGKVTMRRAYDRRDAYNTLAMISWSLWPSVICSCGCTVQECVSYACSDCREDLCSGLEWGVRDIPFRETRIGEFLKQVSSSVEDGTADQSTVEAFSEYKKGLEIIVRISKLLEDVDVVLRAKDFDRVGDIRKGYHDLHMELAQLSIKLLVRSQGPGRLMGLILNGFEWNLKNLGKGMFSVRTAGKDPLYNVAFTYALRGIGTITRLDLDEAQRMVEDCRTLRDKWKDRPYTAESEFVFKVASYGCHLAQMLFRLMPVWSKEEEKGNMPSIPSGGERCD